MSIPFKLVIILWKIMLLHVIQRIVSYILMFQVIFQHFGTLAVTVSVNQNITGLQGNGDTDLTCSFSIGKGETILSVQIISKNKTEDTLAIFKPEQSAKLHSSGIYLSGRVTLTNITSTSNNATMTFHILDCTDEKAYMCSLYYHDTDSAISLVKSETTRILVKVQVGNVHIMRKPNEPYDGKTDNITLTCKANGNPKPTYTWFKENNNESILSTTDFYVIEDVIRNNSGVYICQAYNIINNVTYSKSNSVVIEIVDEIRLLPESVSSKISAASYAVPIFTAVGLTVIFLAVIYRKYCSKQAQIDKDSRCDGYTKKQDYIPVTSNNNTNTVASGDASNGLSENEISYRTKEMDLVPVVDCIQHMPIDSGIYADPKDTVPEASFKDREKYEDKGVSDQSAVYIYAEVIDQTNMDSKMSNGP